MSRMLKQRNERKLWDEIERKEIESRKKNPEKFSWYLKDRTLYYVRPLIREPMFNKSTTPKLLLYLLAGLGGMALIVPEVNVRWLLFFMILFGVLSYLFNEVFGQNKEVDYSAKRIEFPAPEDYDNIVINKKDERRDNHPPI